MSASIKTRSISGADPRGSRAARRAWWSAWLGLALLAAACSTNGPPEPVPEPPDAPALPALDRLSPAVAERVRGAHGKLLETLAPGAGDPARAVEAWAELGKVAMAAEFPDLAETCLLRAAALDPENFVWPYYLGHLYRERGRSRDAVARLEQALRLRPEELPVIGWLARTHHEQGRDDLADPLFRRMLELHPESAFALYHLGKIALERQQYETAVRRMEQALELLPGATVIHYPLALAYRGLGDGERAREHLERRGEIDVYPHDPWMDDLRRVLGGRDSVLSRGSRLYAAGRYGEAVETYLAGLQETPGDADLLVNLGSAQFRLGERDRALAAYRRALESNPDHPRALYGIGAVHETEGDDETARALYESALERDPALPPAHLRLAQLLRRGRELAAALPHYRAVLAVDPLHAEARFGTVMALVGLGRHGEARELLEEAVRLLPEQPAFRHALARLLVASPEPEVRDGRRALELLQELGRDHSNTDLAESIAMALAEVGRFEQAVEWQRSAMRFAEKAGHREQARRMESNLASYENGRPCRVPWRSEDPVQTPGRNAEPAPVLGPARS